MKYREHMWFPVFFFYRTHETLNSDNKNTFQRISRSVFSKTGTKLTFSNLFPQSAILDMFPLHYNSL